MWTEGELDGVAVLWYVSPGGLLLVGLPCLTVVHLSNAQNIWQKVAVETVAKKHFLAH